MKDWPWDADEQKRRAESNLPPLGNPNLISMDAFDDDFTSTTSPSGENLWEATELTGIDENRIWSVVEGDSGDLIACAGRHRVGLQGFVVTERPWTDPKAEAMWFPDNPDE